MPQRASVDSDSDSLPPLAPDEDDESGGVLDTKETDLDDFDWEPQVAPPELPSPHLAPSADGAELRTTLSRAELRRHGARVVEEVYSHSCDEAEGLVVDTVRALHPFWDKVNEDSEIGRRVSWVRSSNDWVYGELTSHSFEELVEQRLAITGDEVFVDLGSGTGKIVALASLYFRHAVGLEVQPALHERAQVLADTLKRRLQGHGVEAKELSLCSADFLDKSRACWTSTTDGRPWWEIADVAYACSPKFCTKTMHSLAELAALMRSGAQFVTVRHALKTADLDEVWRGDAEFSWGRDTLIVHRRR